MQEQKQNRQRTMTKRPLSDSKLMENNASSEPPQTTKECRIGNAPFRTRRMGFVSTMAFMLSIPRSTTAFSPSSVLQPPSSSLHPNDSSIVMKAPATMFMDTLNSAATRLLQPSSSSRSSALPPPETLVERKRNRGVLGFQLHPHNEDDAALTRLKVSSSSSSESSSSITSNLDAQTWNLARPLPFDLGRSKSSSFRLPWESLYQEQKQAAALHDKRDLSAADIASFTVAQLKVELGSRGLKKTGNKADLQERLLDWHNQQQHKENSSSLVNLQRAYGKMTANSLAEWARTVDLEPLMQRRKAIHREKLVGKKTKQKKKADYVIPADYRAVLKKVFDRPSSLYSNREVKQMYAAAKAADQVGDRELAKTILLELKKATPHDARLYSRLSRLERESGNVAKARAFLEEGLKLYGDNAFLWNGLGQLEGSIGDVNKQKECLRKAIEVDPSTPHAHHALGTLEHTQGHIASAMKILKRGVEYCPKNHRLHHALGDIYRDAKMLDMATRSYRKALQFGPPVSHGFAYTALSYVAYEQQNARACRHWLHRAVELNNGRHANGWVALAQMEESEGNIEAARAACTTAISLYERGLLKRAKRLAKPVDYDLSSKDPIAIKNDILKRVPTRSGDRFFNVYRTWLRLEERYGTMDAFVEVYERAVAAFPHHWKFSLDAAEYFARQGFQERARLCFSEACRRAESQHADPFRLFAAYEMSHGNFALARQILYTGALNLADKRETDIGNRRGLAELFYTWAVCEWHMNCLPQAATLFSYALDELSTTGENSAKLRSFLLFVMARFELARKEYRRAQHFVGLCLREGHTPGGNAQVWEIWERIATGMGDPRLALRCRQQSLRASTIDIVVPTSLQSSELKSHIRRDPWHHKLFGNNNHQGESDKLFCTSNLPDEILEVPLRHPFL